MNTLCEGEGLILEDYPDEDMEMIITVKIGKKRKFGIVNCMTGLLFHEMKVGDGKEYALDMFRHGAENAMNKIFEEINKELK
jgi:hypothetical protein